jgi:hypothetical protein
MTRREGRDYEVSLDEDRGTARVWVVDGSGRPISYDERDRRYWCSVVGVHTREQAVAAAKERGLRLDGANVVPSLLPKSS